MVTRPIGEAPVETLAQRIVRHEGLRLKPYRDPVGKWTIGVGRNLDDTGISADEAQMLLANDLTRTVHQLTAARPWVDDLPPIARDVLIEMAFQMGTHGLLRFTATLDAFERHDFARAAENMRHSTWATQTPARAEELAGLIQGLA